ncbi:ATP-grasp domain-containing protein [Azospirillum sp.]|uniref:ATP-grasp domain-containing protein n=1 Tax=Azospirillum sp. TaxID=34012 RepID=UPI003D747EA5
MTTRVFVCEYVTGGGLEDGPMAALLPEAEMMVAALVQDLTAVEGVQVTLARDRRLPPPGVPVPLHRVSADDPWWQWERALAGHDALWPLAPETGGLLERLSRMAADAGVRLLGSAPDAVAVAASKSATAAALAAVGVPVVPTFPPDAPPPAGHGWVLKPDDGAGAEGVRRITIWSDVGDTAGMVVQSYVPGVPASLSVLCRDGRAWLLSANAQRIEIDAGGAFAYRGSDVGALAGRAAELRPLAEAVAAALPGLWGYVGIDLVLTDAGPVVVEVNPRLTTSYVGLRRALRVNPVALVLALLTGEPHPPDAGALPTVEVRV